MHFRSIFRLLTLCLFGAYVISVSAAVDEPYKVGDWGNFCQGAVSFTFDDNTPNQISVAQPMFDAKGLHMTFFPVANWGPNWTNYKAAFAKGHEIGSHSISHPNGSGAVMPDAEIDSSQKVIKKNVPGEMCVSIAYPNCVEPDEATLKKYYIVGRTCSGQTNAKTPSNMFQVGSYICGNAGTLKTAKNITDKADAAATSSGWCILLMHAINTEGDSYSPLASTILQEVVTYMDSNRGKIWVETMGNVARYIKERDAASVTKKDSTDKSFTITVKDNLADSIFNYPLTIRRPLPDGWTNAYVFQGTKDVKDTIVTIDSKKYVMFQAIPDSGDVAISKEPPVGVISHTSAFTGSGAFPIKLQRATLMIDSRQFNGSDLSVTLFNLSGKVLARYTLGSNESRIALSTEKISHSAFIAKVTGGSKTWSGKFMSQM